MPQKDMIWKKKTTGYRHRTLARRVFPCQGKSYRGKMEIQKIHITGPLYAIEMADRVRMIC
jgi:hypothetical protein